MQNQWHEPLNIWEIASHALYLPFLSPGRGSTHPEAPCWSVSIATTQSARRASTSATRAPSSRRAFTPGNDLTRSPWPLTSLQPRHCYPDLHHGNEKSTACPLLPDPQTDVDVRQPREEDDTHVNIRLPPWLHTGHRTLRWDGGKNINTSFNKCGETRWRSSEPFLWRRWFSLLDIKRPSVWTEGCLKIKNQFTEILTVAQMQTKEYKHTHKHTRFIFRTKNYGCLRK